MCEDYLVLCLFPRYKYVCFRSAGFGIGLEPARYCQETYIGLWTTLEGTFYFFTVTLHFIVKMDFYMISICQALNEE